MVCDLLSVEQIRQVIERIRPEIVIHTQALSDVDQCEREPDAAWAQNVTATEQLIRALEPLKALLIYVSTDYVFDGSKRAPYDENDSPRPISVYGRSKLKAEQRVLAYERSVIVRPSTLFGPGRMNFCDHVATQVKAGHSVEAFVDQVTSPTYTEDLADGIGELSAALLRAQATQWPRVYHMANAGGCSRVVFAQRVAELLGCSRSLIHPIPMAQYRQPTPRPSCSALSTIHVPHVIGRTLRSWDDALHAYLRQHHPFDSAEGELQR